MLQQWVISQDTTITSLVSPMRLFFVSLLTSLMTADGFYVHGSILGGNFVHLCFSHDLSKGASTYLVAYTPEQIITNLKYVADNEPSWFYRPFFLDSIIAKYYLEHWMRIMRNELDFLLQWVCTTDFYPVIKFPDLCHVCKFRNELS